MLQVILDRAPTDSKLNLFRMTVYGFKEQQILDPPAQPSFSSTSRKSAELFQCRVVRRPSFRRLSVKFSLKMLIFQK